MSDESLSLREIEELGYYEFMGYMGVPFFNVGGAASIDRLAEMCRIDETSHVLNVGCGTGTNSIYLAKKYGCRVTGVDIAEPMIRKAVENAEESGQGELVDFKVGDAYNLQFPEDSFDVVITVFVSQFLEPGRAFPEFLRVLKPGGRLGVNEMYKADQIPSEALDRVQVGEDVFRNLTELPFTLRTPSTWTGSFTGAGFSEVRLELHRDFLSQGVNLDIIRDFGGLGFFLGTLWRMLVLAVKSSKIRARYGKISRGKRVLLHDRVASKYIGYILCAGEKP